MALLGVIFYLLNSGFGSESVGVFIFLGFAALIIILILAHCLQGVLFKRRIKAFAELAQKYSLEHKFVNFILFEPYGVLNSLTGKMNGSEVVVSDILLQPSIKTTVENIAAQGIVTGVVTGTSLVASSSCFLRTVILMDGKNISSDNSKDLMSIENVKKHLNDIVCNNVKVAN